MITKFTKGNWVVNIDKDGAHARITYPHGFLTSSNVIQIDESRLDGESWIGMRDRTEVARENAQFESVANIHLMGAAPEMYNMLESIFFSMECFHGVDTNAIDELLAKARGEIN